MNMVMIFVLLCHTFYILGDDFNLRCEYCWFVSILYSWIHISLPVILILWSYHLLRIVAKCLCACSVGSIFVRCNKSWNEFCGGVPHAQILLWVIGVKAPSHWWHWFFSLHSYLDRWPDDGLSYDFWPLLKYICHANCVDLLNVISPIPTFN